MKRFALLFVTAFLLTATAFAQHGSGSDVYFGYAHATGDPGQNGWNLSGSYGLAPIAAAEVDLGSYYGSGDFHTVSFTVGPKVMMKMEKGKFTPYGHLLFGIGHNHDGLFGTSDTSFAWYLGGGGDYNFSEHMAGRVKVDYMHTQFYGSGQGHARIGFGVAAKW